MRKEFQYQERKKMSCNKVVYRSPWQIHPKNVKSGEDAAGILFTFKNTCACEVQLRISSDSKCVHSSYPQDFKNKWGVLKDTAVYDTGASRIRDNLNLSGPDQCYPHADAIRIRVKNIESRLTFTQKPFTDPSQGVTIEIADGGLIRAYDNSKGRDIPMNITTYEVFNPLSPFT